MLILVTVTITVALKGELFNTAKQAKTETKNKINEEQNLASGKVEIDGEWYDSINEYINGKKPKPEEYGTYVDYGLDLNGDEDTTNDWKVFYVDGNGHTFIIAADYVTGDKCEALKTAIGKLNMQQRSGPYDSYKYCYYWDSKDSTEYHCYDRHNSTIINDRTKNTQQCSFPELFMATGYYCSDHVGSDGKGGNPNSRCASNLMCTEDWNTFVANSAKKEYADYAIGGPTLEMWVASWNQRHGKDIYIENGITLYANGSNNSDSACGYYVGDDKDTTDGKYNITSCTSGYNDTLYFPHKDHVLDIDDDGLTDLCFGYWLASPSNAFHISLGCEMMDINCMGTVNYYDPFDNLGSFGLRPLVCLKSDVKLTKVLNDDGSVAYYSLSK